MNQPFDWGRITESQVSALIESLPNMTTTTVLRMFIAGLIRGERSNQYLVAALRDEIDLRIPPREKGRHRPIRPKENA